MELNLKRIARKKGYTIGRLFIDGKYFCDTLEDTDRGLSQSAPYASNKRKKIKGETAIPTGKYRVTLDVRSQRFGSRSDYQFCNGYLPRLINVPCFEGVLIHIGNTDKHTEGCILVGQNKVVGMVVNSKDTFVRLYKRLQDDRDNIYIRIE